MDQVTFDRFARRAAGLLDRRSLFGGLGAALFAAAAGPVAIGMSEGRRKCADAEDELRPCYTIGRSHNVPDMKRRNAMGTTSQQLESLAATPQKPDDEQPAAPVPSDTSPEAFYAEITKRADVRAILEVFAFAS